METNIDLAMKILPEIWELVIVLCQIGVGLVFAAFCFYAMVLIIIDLVYRE